MPAWSSMYLPRHAVHLARTCRAPCQGMPHTLPGFAANISCYKRSTDCLLGQQSYFLALNPGMDESEAHLFDQAELENERLEERNGEDIEDEVYGPRSDDGSDTPGSLDGFITEGEETPDGIGMYAAFERERSLERAAPPRRKRGRRIVVRAFLDVLCINGVVFAFGVPLRHGTLGGSALVRGPARMSCCC